MILAIDPGTHTGWALFKDSLLVACGLGDPRTSTAHVMRDITDVIIEHPVIYSGGRTRNPNDVLKVAVNAGEWAGTYRQKALVRYVTPQAWKGSVPKDVHQPRILAKLAPKEAEVLEASLRRVAKSKHNNVVDAVGLGLFHVGR